MAFMRLWRAVAQGAGLLAALSTAAYAAGSVDPDVHGNERHWNGVTNSIDSIENVVRFQMEFEPVGDPVAGAVRVILTPERPQPNVLEIRKAAEDAFLQTLNEPGLGDSLVSVEVVVKPHPDRAILAVDQRFRFATSDGRIWRIVSSPPTNK